MDKRKITSKLNGAKSHGPISLIGKRWSCKNALKHGLRSSLPGLTVGENREEFEAFMKKGIGYYKPFDFYSHEVFERMMHQLWKLKLIPKIESGVYAYEILTYEADDQKMKCADQIRHQDFSESDLKKVNYQNLLLGIAFSKDSTSGNALLKLGTYESKLLNKFFQLEKIYIDYKGKKHGSKKTK